MNFSRTKSKPKSELSKYINNLIDNQMNFINIETTIQQASQGSINALLETQNPPDQVETTISREPLLYERMNIVLRHIQLSYIAIPDTHIISQNYILDKSCSLEADNKDLIKLIKNALIFMENNLNNLNSFFVENQSHIKKYLKADTNNTMYTPKFILMRELLNEINNIVIKILKYKNDNYIEKINDMIQSLSSDNKINVINFLEDSQTNIIGLYKYDCSANIKSQVDNIKQHQYTIEETLLNINKYYSTFSISSILHSYPSTYYIYAMKCISTLNDIINYIEDKNTFFTDLKEYTTNTIAILFSNNPLQNNYAKDLYYTIPEKLNTFITDNVKSNVETTSQYGIITGQLKHKLRWLFSDRNKNKNVEKNKIKYHIIFSIANNYLTQPYINIKDDIKEISVQDIENFVFQSNQCHSPKLLSKNKTSKPPINSIGIHNYKFDKTHNILFDMPNNRKRPYSDHEDLINNKRKKQDVNPNTIEESSVVKYIDSRRKLQFSETNIAHHLGYEAIQSNINSLSEWQSDQIPATSAVHSMNTNYEPFQVSQYIGSDFTNPETAANSELIFNPPIPPSSYIKSINTSLSEDIPYNYYQRQPNYMFYYPNINQYIPPLSLRQYNEKAAINGFSFGHFQIKDLNREFDTKELNRHLSIDDSTGKPTVTNSSTQLPIYGSSRQLPIEQSIMASTTGQTTMRNHYIDETTISSWTNQGAITSYSTDLPLTTAIGQSPMYATTGRFPMPAPTGRFTMPTPTGQFPMPAPAGQFPMPAPTGRFPMPAPTGRFTMPTPTGQFPMPAPTGRFPMPAPTGRFPMPAPIRRFPIYEPAGESPIVLANSSSQKNNHAPSEKSSIENPTISNTIGSLPISSPSSSSNNILSASTALSTPIDNNLPNELDYALDDIDINKPSRVE